MYILVLGEGKVPDAPCTGYTLGTLRLCRAMQKADGRKERESKSEVERRRGVWRREEGEEERGM